AVGLRSANQVSTAARGDGRPSGRECASLRNQLIERGLAVDLSGGIDVKVDCPHAARGAHRYANHGVGVLLPPREDLCLVSGCVLEAIRAERALVDWVARKDRNTAARIVERGLEHGRDCLCLRTHVVPLSAAIGGIVTAPKKP